MKLLDVMPKSGRGSWIAFYPWAEWFDGRPREAERGVDYTVSDAAFRSCIHAAAKRHGGRVQTAITSSGTQFQFTKTEQP